MTEGPQALKLIDVAKAAGVSHATVLHHFGTIDAVQTGLMERMIADLVARMLTPDPVEGREAPVSERISRLFDAFGGAGARLAAWLELNGDSRRLTFVKAAVRAIVEERVAAVGSDPAVAEDGVLLSVTLALGAGLFGRTLSALLDRPPEAASDVAVRFLLRTIEASEPKGAAAPETRT